MAYHGYVFEMKEEYIFPHPNADKLVLCKIFDTQCIISKDYRIGELYIFFPESGRLSDEYCQVNDLVRRKDENGNPAGGFLEPGKQNVKTIRLRKEVSEGMIMNIASLATFGDVSELRAGDTIDTFNGHEICRKYIPRRNPPSTHAGERKNKKSHHKVEVEYVFPQHCDTEQLRFCLNKFKCGDLITISEKLEGTSFREIMSPVKKKNNFIRKLLHLPEKMVYEPLCGTRRTTVSSDRGGYYGTNAFRLDVHNQIVPHLRPNLEVFGEIVGWTGEGGTPIMGEVDTTCLQDKEFTKKYGKKMIFHYGCEEGTYDFYIYRIAEIDNEGDVVVEYSTDQIKRWCEMNGFKMVPILYRGFIPDGVNAGEYVMELAKQYCDGESTIAPHWREGCVIRRDNIAGKFDVAKHKNDSYKIMKGMFVEKLDNVETIDEDILAEL